MGRQLSFKNDQAAEGLQLLHEVEKEDQQVLIAVEYSPISPGIYEYVHVAVSFLKEAKASPHRSTYTL